MTTKPLLPADIRVLAEQIYQYQKGVRQMVLHTIPRCYQAQAERKLDHQGIDYIVQPVSDQVVNLFFGRRACLETIRPLLSRPLCDLSPEEDFMLGALLGYDLTMQCERYCRRKHISCGDCATCAVAN